MGVRRQGSNIFYMIKGTRQNKTCQPKILYAVRVSFQTTKAKQEDVFKHPKAK